MADVKITALTVLTAADPINDAIPIVDVSNPIMAASGTTSRISINNLLSSSPTATGALTVTGLVTAGSATITGDLTVNTNVLKVDTTLDRVSINTTTFATDSVFAVKTTAGKFDVRAEGSLSVKLNSDQAMLYNVPTGSAHSFQINDSTAMTLDSTGLGIGGSAAYKLDVVGPVMRLINSAATADIFITDSGTTNGNVRLRGESNALKFITGGGVSATIDSSGNVGIGVTPSAWTGGVKALDMGSGGLGLFSNGGITVNAFFDSTDSRWEYKTNGPATFYNLQTGVHQWFVAASGTANNPITTFATAAMELTAAGNLAFPTGKGIDFSATASGSGTMTSELLNDYEEGTWTGTLTGGTTNPTTPVTATGRYTKIGRVVTVQIYFNNVNTLGASGLIGITGLPFTNNASVGSTGIPSFYNIATFTGSPFVALGVNESFLNCYSNISNTAFGNVTHNAGASGNYFTTSITYTVA